MIVYDYIRRFLLTFRVFVRKPFSTYLYRWLFVLFIVGCEDNNEPNEPNYYVSLSVETDSLMTIENDEYIYHYPRERPHTYTKVFAETNKRNGRVFWFSPDSFEYVYQNILFKECVINYPTYCIDEIEWRRFECEQLVYLNKSLIGDTIEVFGYINEEIIDTTRFVIK